jgi:periplasmic protein TonB
MTFAFKRPLPRALLAGGALFVAALIGGVVWRGHPVPAMTGTSADATVADAGSDETPTAILLGLARTAIRENRLIAPQGNNAFEYYMSVLDLDKTNVTAHEAMRESLPLASEQIDRAIRDKDLDEALREITLLREYDPDNYVLLILGAKLDAQRKLVTAQNEARARAMRGAVEGL